MGLLQQKQERFDEALASLSRAKTVFEELDASLDLAEVEKALELMQETKGGVP
jgi:flagellin-specific chaperone FliS